MVDDSLTSRINVPETIRTERANYANFMNKHGADEVLDFAPTKEQLNAIQPQSTFNPNKKLTREEADALLRDRSAAQKLGIYNDEMSYAPNAIDDRLGIQHLLDEDRRPFVRTLSNTMERPDVKFSDGNRDYIAKSYGKEGGKNFFDWTILEDNNVVSKYPTEARKIAKEIKKSAQNMSLSGRVPLGRTGETYSHSLMDNNSVSLKPVVVNSELPHVNSLYDGLTEFQAKELKSAFNTGLSKTNAKAGSLESLNKVKQEINERISKAQATDKPNEVLNFAPTKEQLVSYPAQSKFNLPKGKLSRDEAEKILFDRADKSGEILGGDIKHFTQDAKRTRRVRTLSNTLEKPDIVFSNGEKGYTVKKYDTDGKPFYDFVAKKKDDLWTKFPTDENYVLNQIKKCP